MSFDFLIVAPDAVDGDFLIEICNRLSYSFEAVRSVTEAQERLQKIRYNVVLCPIDDDCYKTLRQTTAELSYEPAYIVISEFDTLSKAHKLIAEGVFGYIRKPLLLNECLYLIQAALLDEQQTNLFENEGFHLFSTVNNISQISDLVPVSWCLSSEIKNVLPHMGFLYFNCENFDDPTVAVKDIEGQGLERFTSHAINRLIMSTRQWITQLKKPVDFRLTPETPLKLEMKPFGPAVLIPLREKKGVTAAMYLFVADCDPGDEDICTLGLQSNIVYTVYQQVHSAKRLAYIDELTGVYNMRYLDLALDQELRRADRYNQHVSVLFLDLDHFKSVNDRHGHMVGSQLLIKVSEQLTRCLRDVDTIIRYGGDEYVCVLPNTDKNGALLVAERIRGNLEDEVFVIEDATIKLTSSIGVSTYPDHARSKGHLLAAADAAMYVGKKRRNHVCIAGVIE